jgi:hypothetical protein
VSKGKPDEIVFFEEKEAKEFFPLGDLALAVSPPPKWQMSSALF